MKLKKYGTAITVSFILVYHSTYEISLAAALKYAWIWKLTLKTIPEFMFVLITTTFGRSLGAVEIWIRVFIHLVWWLIALCKNVHISPINVYLCNMILTMWMARRRRNEVTNNKFW